MLSLICEVRRETSVRLCVVFSSAACRRITEWSVSALWPLINEVLLLPRPCWRSLWAGVCSLSPEPQCQTGCLCLSVFINYSAAHICGFIRLAHRQKILITHKAICKTTIYDMTRAFRCSCIDWVTLNSLWLKVKMSQRCGKVATDEQRAVFIHTGESLYAWPIIGNNTLQRWIKAGGGMTLCRPLGPRTSAKKP